jgi:hypothetical protein
MFKYHEMKKLMIVAVCAMAVMMSCKNKGQNAAGEGVDSDSVAVDSVLAEMPDTAPRPMFLYTHDKGHMQVVYWSSIEKPKKDDYSEGGWEQAMRLWSLQEKFRRNAAKYTSLLLSDKSVVAIKYTGEVLTNPDGEKIWGSELHGRPEIPSAGANFTMENPKLFKDEICGMSVIVCDEYLQSRQVLKIIGSNGEKRLPQEVVKQLEKKYGMKASRSVLSCNIEGDYLYGAIQFAGEYKNAPKFPGEDNVKIKKALALEVLIKGDKVWTLEQIGSIYPGEGPTWNADDGGEYFPNSLAAAFEGPKGLELCYVHGAPESITVGMLFPREDKLEDQMYECYHAMIDEEIPVWKKDIAEMNKLFVAKDPSSYKDIKLTKWAHIWMDDYETEWIHLMDKDEQYGGIFVRKNGKIQLMQVEEPKRKFLKMEANGIAYLKYAGPAGGPTWATEIYGYKGGKQVEHFEMLEVEGEIDGCGLNDKDLTPEEGRAYVSKLSDAQPLNQNWHDIDEN